MARPQPDQNPLDGYELDGQAGKLVVRDIGPLLSGELEAPILDADAIIAEDGRIAATGRAADSAFMDRAQHPAGADLPASVQDGNLPGIGMVVIDGLVRDGRRRNIPPAERVPEMAA